MATLAIFLAACTVIAGVLSTFVYPHRSRDGGHNSFSPPFPECNNESRRDARAPG